MPESKFIAGSQQNSSHDFYSACNWNNKNMKLEYKIIHCLKKYPETRNSDILLTRAVWYEFHNSKIFEHNGKTAIYTEDLMELPREDHVKRIRAKIQNDKANPRYLPTTEEVLKKRKILEKHWHLAMSPSNPARG
jgi:hypothetical protein